MLQRELERSLQSLEAIDSFGCFEKSQRGTYNAQRQQIVFDAMERVRELLVMLIMLKNLKPLSIETSRISSQISGLFKQRSQASVNKDLNPLQTEISNICQQISSLYQQRHQGFQPSINRDLKHLSIEISGLYEQSSQALAIEISCICQQRSQASLNKDLKHFFNRNLKPLSMEISRISSLYQQRSQAFMDRIIREASTNRDLKLPSIIISSHYQ